MVKEGYKQTEIGMIPEDWEIVKLSSLSDGGFQNGVFYEVSRKGTGIGIINVGDIYGKAPVIFQELEKFDATSEEKRRFNVNDGDLFFTRSSIVPSGIAYCNWYKKTSAYEETVFDSHVIRFKTNTNIVNPMYLYLHCVSKYARNYFMANAKTATMTTIDQQTLGNCFIAFAPLSEQNKIAEALADIDELISSLEKLIAKKKAIKQGAMQQLLTGKTRLPGYTDKWKQNTFVELFDILPNNAYTRDQLSVGGTIKNIHYGDILTKYGAVLDGQSKTIPKLAPDLEKKKRPESQFVHNGDIIIADTAEDETVGKAVELYNVNCKILSGQHTFFCHPKIEFAPMFLGYYLNSTEFHAQMLPYITGTKVSSISKQILNLLIVRYPRKEEQEAIAKILFEMDCEIEALEKKREKVIKHKQGMMQQLLTGKIRLM